MANRTFLMVLDSPYETLPNDVAPPSCVVGAASYTLPLAWMALFSAEDVKMRTVGEDGEEETYPVLSCMHETAMSRVRRNWSQIESIIGRGDDVFRQFLEHLAKWNGKYIAVETYELWMMNDPEDAFDEEMKQALRAFTTPHQVRKSPDTVPPEWDTLLGYAAVNLRHLDMTTNAAIAGYEWSQDVPWKANDECLVTPSGREKPWWRFW